MPSNTNILIAQGGGPTAVINQSLIGIIVEERKNNSKIYGSVNGVNGIINNKFMDLNIIQKQDLNTIGNTPGAALGSTREKPDAKYCLEILKILKKKDIRKFYYIGGNDSSDSLRIIADHSKKINYPLQCIHIPKTIDNDLVKNDHTPGFGSAAKYVAQLFSGVNFDVKSLPGVYLGIVMGRHAGFLTCSSALLRENKDDGPHLIFIPEIPFELDVFLNGVKKKFNQFGRCVIAISEGIQDKKKKLISQKINKKVEYDAHGNIQLSGTSSLGDFLANKIKSKLKISRVRSDTLGYPQRCFLGSASEIDQKEAFLIASFAVKHSKISNKSFSVGIKERKVFSRNYNVGFQINKLEDVAGKTKTLPLNFFDKRNHSITSLFKNYAIPLIGKKIPETKSII